MRQLWVAVLGVSACSTQSSMNEHYVNGFNPQATPAGYTRYVTPPIYQVNPGDDIILCQWLAPASDHDVDIIDVNGAQSLGGHHVVLYASSNVDEAVGTSRPCTAVDTEGVQFLGAIGGEGSSHVTLPAGMVFRLQKGKSLMANVHYLNATTHTYDAQSVVDVRYAPVTPTSRVAAMLVVNAARFAIPPEQSYSMDGYCAAPSDLSLIMFADHLHEHGTSIFNEVIHADGTHQMLASDPSWTRDMIFNPTWHNWDLANPVAVKMGDQLHVHCEWQSTVDKALTFPDEMCIGLGFFTEGGDQIVCNAT